MHSIKAVIFDLDDTLIRSGIDYRRMKTLLIKFLVESGVESNLLNENMLNLEIFRTAAENLRKKNFPENKIKNVLDRANQILNEVEMESLSKVRLMEGALETLLALKNRNVKVGIITNGCRRYAIEVIKMLSLEKYIDALVARDDVTDYKPSPEHLLKALEILGVSTSETIFVGDHWIDALCAKNAGVKFILLKGRDEYKVWNFRGVEDTIAAAINDLRELLRLL
jgi:HAD superfamily hydrolase (TIGR01549 family)